MVEVMVLGIHTRASGISALEIVGPTLSRESASGIAPIQRHHELKHLTLIGGFLLEGFQYKPEWCQKVRFGVSVDTHGPSFRLHQAAEEKSGWQTGVCEVHMLHQVQHQPQKASVIWGLDRFQNFDVHIATLGFSSTVLLCLAAQLKVGIKWGK